jgi:hypothetical protein
MLFFGPAVRGRAAPAEPAGKTRTYYVAADDHMLAGMVARYEVKPR